MSKTVIRVSDETAKLVKAHAKTKGVELNEAAEALITTGHKRLSALTSYNNKNKTGAKKGKKAAGKKTAKKAAARKAAPKVVKATKPAKASAPRKPRPKKEQPAKSARVPKPKAAAAAEAPEQELDRAVGDEE